MDFPLSEANGRMADDRDFVGYGANPPDPQWPGGARIAVNINLNFEGGGERLVMEGEGVLNDMGMSSLPGVRSPIVESVFEYGSRVGGWRLLRLFRRFGVKICLLAVAKAAERNPELTRALVEDYRQPRISLARLPDARGRGRARACPARHRDDRAYCRGASSRVDDGTAER
jgi:peptidoglycan/xylan/chitin deacetylase (PgdA/CDA1 family)